MKNRLIIVFVKIVLAIALLALLGLPIVQNWKMFSFLAGILALIYSDIILEKKRIIWGMGVFLSILIIKSLLPAAGIEEGHNIFICLRDGEALQRSLPAAVFNDWRREFDSVYPAVDPPYGADTWRYVSEKAGGLPDRAYAYSSDALWRPAKYSRKVDEIAFSSLAGFRGGFANDARYNWWNGDLSRKSMPFFVMYEFSDRSAGCELFWKGALFWEKPDGSYEKILHPALSGRTISPTDVGKKAYLFFLPQKAPVFPVHLKLNRTLAASRTLGNILAVIGISCIYFFMARLRWKPFLTAAAIVAIAMTVVYAGIAFSGGKPLGSYYTPQGGGDDGLFHESLGRQMAKALAEGHLLKAIEGYEPVYWFTPGMRYFRALEKIIFGDTNLGLTAFLACLPWFVFLFVQRLCGAKWACMAVFIFLFSPVSFSFAQYIVCGLLGYAEPVASGLFFLGSFLFMKSQPRWGGSVSARAAFIGGACLAGAVFLRPNYAIAAFFLGAFFLYAALRDRYFQILFPALAGLGLALFMPIHNYYFGHQFYLISKSGATVSLTLSPMTYLRAFGEWITGHWQGPHLSQAVHQIKGWLWTPPLDQFPLRRGISLFLSFRLLTLFATLYALFISPRRLPCAALLAWVALAAHVPMLFVFATQLRYSLLGWDLSMMVTIMLAAYVSRRHSLALLWKRRGVTENSYGMGEI